MAAVEPASGESRIKSLQAALTGPKPESAASYARMETHDGKSINRLRVEESLMPFVVKTAVGTEARADLLSFTEKTMYRGKEIGANDEIFVFASENQGGQGLCARGVIMSVDRGPGIRLSIKVRPVAEARRSLGRRELKPFRDLKDDDPRTEIARKLYRQATNKIARVSDEAAAFLRTYF